VPTCQVQLGEVVTPGLADPLSLTPFLRFLAERLDDLRPLLRHPVPKRVGLHEHPGVAGVPQAAEAILRMIPAWSSSIWRSRASAICATR